VLGDGLRVFDGGQPGLGPRRAPLHVDVEPAQPRQVEHDAAVAHAEQAVAAAADGEVQTGLARLIDHPRHVGAVGDPDDDRGTSVDPAGKDGARLVVLRIVRRDHLTVDVGA
jgi:hypothetical protein